jgi:hypothetical protein
VEILGAGTLLLESFRSASRSSKHSGIKLMDTGLWDFSYNELAHYCVHWWSLMSEVFFLFCSATNSNCYCIKKKKKLPYILESNPHPFYSFRGLKNQMRITIACGLDSRSRAGFWKNYGDAVRAVRTTQYNNLLFYLLLIIIYYSSDSPVITHNWIVIHTQTRIRMLVEKDPLHGTGMTHRPQA